MTSALEKLTNAIEAKKSRGRGILSFVFRYGGYEFDYMGRYYAYVYEGSSRNLKTEDEYGWRDYADMLKSVVNETGKTVAGMLTELSERDLENMGNVAMLGTSLVKAVGFARRANRISKTASLS